MEYSQHRFTLDLHKTKSGVSINVAQFDTAVMLVISLTDGGKPYTLKGVDKLVVCGKKADGNVFMDGLEDYDDNVHISEDGSKIIYTFSEQTASWLGIVECDIRLYGGDKLILTTPKFNLVVMPRAVTSEDEDRVESEVDLSALDKAFQSEIAREAAEEQRQENELAREAAEEQRQENELAREAAEEQRGEAVREAVALVGDLEAALDAILAIQKAILNGELGYEVRTDYWGNEYYVVTGRGSYKSDNIVIPAERNGVPVTEIAEEAFKDDLNIKSVVIGNNIETIGARCFEGCNNIESIDLLRTGGYGYILGESVSAYVLTSENAASWLTQAQDIEYGYISTGMWAYFDVEPYSLRRRV